MCSGESDVGFVSGGGDVDLWEGFEGSREDGVELGREAGEEAGGSLVEGIWGPGGWG